MTLDLEVASTEAIHSLLVEASSRAPSIFYSYRGHGGMIPHPFEIVLHICIRGLCFRRTRIFFVYSTIRLYHNTENHSIRIEISAWNLNSPLNTRTSSVIIDKSPLASPVRRLKVSTNISINTKYMLEFGVKSLPLPVNNCAN